MQKYSIKYQDGICEFLNHKCQQHPDAFVNFYNFLKKEKPKRILEIGTGLGGFTLFLKLSCAELNLNCEIITFDIIERYNKNLLSNLKIDCRIENIFNEDYSQVKKEIIEFIQNDGVTLILCDGQNKIKEFNLLAQYMKEEDFIMAHDYCATKEIFEKQIKNQIWNWHEICDFDIQQSNYINSLKSYGKENFDKCVWVCKKKKNKSKKNKICHVVFSSNRKHYLERTFASKSKINYENLEVHKIFIDDYPLNRNDEEIIELAKYHGFNEIILHEENLGISKTWQEFFDLVKNRNFDYILHHEDDVELTNEVKIHEIISLLEQNADLYQIQLKRNNWYPHETETDFKKDSDIITNNYRLEKQDTYFWMLFSIYPAWITKEPILKETGNNPAEGVIAYYLKSKHNLTGGILKTLNGDIMVNHFGEYTQGKRCLENEPGWDGFKVFDPQKKYCSKTGKEIKN